MLIVLGPGGVNKHNTSHVMFMINWIEKLLRKLPPTTPEASASYLAGLSGFSFFDTGQGSFHGGGSGALMSVCVCYRTDQLSGQRLPPGLWSVDVIVVVVVVVAAAVAVGQ